jgi:hypothetical protein
MEGTTMGYCHNHSLIYEIRVFIGLSPFGTAATVWPIVPAPDDRQMMIVEQAVECELAGETEVLGENLPLYHFGHHKSRIT